MFPHKLQNEHNLSFNGEFESSKLVSEPGLSSYDYKGAQKDQILTHERMYAKLWGLSGVTKHNLRKHLLLLAVFRKFCYWCFQFSAGHLKSMQFHFGSKLSFEQAVNMGLFFLLFCHGLLGRVGWCKIVRSEIRELSYSSVGNVRRILVKVRERENVKEPVWKKAFN